MAVNGRHLEVLQRTCMGLSLTWPLSVSRLYSYISNQHFYSYT